MQRKAREMNADDRLLINLRIIASVHPHQRINAKNELLEIECTTFSTWIYRWMRGDGRMICLRRLNEILNESIIKVKESQKNKRLRDKFLAHLDNSRPGLKNLLQTYSEDVATKSHIELLIERVDETLSEYKYEPSRVVTINEIPISDDSDSDSDDTEDKSATD